nr:similar to XM_051720 TBP associated factor in Homo sapiens [Schistosoma japonicum]
MDRAHRIGQLRTVNVYRLITENSVEEQIMNLQAFKLYLATTVLTPENKSLCEMDTQHLFDRLMAHNDDRVSRETRTVDQFALLDDLEACYEAEYNLDTFLSRLKSN